MNNPSVEMRERVKITQDMLDRGGLGAAQVHKILPVAEDPVEALFRDILADPNGLMGPQADLIPPALEGSPSDALVDWGEVDMPSRENSVEGVRQPVAIAPAHRAKPTTGRNPTVPPKHIREGLELLK